ELEEPESVEAERGALDEICAPLEPAPGVAMETVDAGGVPATAFVPASPGPLRLLYCHGGAFALGSSWHVRRLCSRLALRLGAEVIALDSRLAPEHRFPAAHEDADRAYRWLLASGTAAADVVLAGDSCGANLVLAAALRSRDRGEPAARALVCISP